MRNKKFSKDEPAVYNKKAILFIVLLIVCGIICGLILSNIFLNDANERIQRFHSKDHYYCENSNGFINETRNESYWFHKEPLVFSDVVIPTGGVIISCISLFLLLGLISNYVKIFFTSKSKYVAGLLLFLIPWLVKSFFSINMLRTLFVSPRIAELGMRQTIGFGLTGFGGMVVLLTVFEILGLSVLLYLSSE